VKSGMNIMARICRSSYPIPNWKSRGFSIPILILSQCGDFPSKWGRVYLPSLFTRRVWREKNCLSL